MLRVFLFGSARIEDNGQVLALRRSKSLALLAYLAVTGSPQDRDTLLALLWPEFDGERARNNLRRELSLLRASLGAEMLSADRHQIAWSPQVAHWLDVAAFKQQLAQAQRAGPATAAGAQALAAAVALGGEELLAGFGLPDSPAFEEWLFFQREAVRQQLAGALQSLARWHAGRAEYGDAIGLARRWLALDPLHEPAQRELMRLYALAGQHAAALRQYEACARLLEQELGLTPEPETEELYSAIKARRFPEPPDEPRSPAPPPLPAAPQAAPRREPLSNLPPPLGGFIGRELEVGDIIRRLTDPACRLLTLVGPGGIGKTRLALRVARTLASEWADAEAMAASAAQSAIADGVLFVPLASLARADELAGAIAAAARLDGHGAVPPRQQVLDYLRDRRMLLVLDNFEHLLDPAPGGDEAAARFVAELLQAAPGLRLLVTSREALNLQDEWFHAVAGLSFPADADDTATVAALARFDAVRLLDQHARRIRGDFSLSREREHAVRLCRLVEGMPLAIELAASWLKLLSVEQIVVALEQNLDILTTRDRGIHERHRSMRTVLDETWRLLSAGERQVLSALSVCRGGFSAEAAEEIAGASLATLATLVDKALLRADAEGRFQLHELLRQYAAERLAHDEKLQRAARERHSAYYLALVTRQEARLQSREQRAALAAITREAGNLQAAWRWASDAGEAATTDRALLSCYLYFHARSAFKEGDELFSTVGAELRQASPGDDPAFERLAARILVRRGAFRYHLGDYEAAIALIEQGRPAAERLGLYSEVACAKLTLGAIAAWRGDYRAAQEQLEAGLALARACDDRQIVVEALQRLAAISGAYGDYVELRRWAQEGLQVARAVGQPDWMARALRMGSVAATYSEEYGEAERYASEAQALAESISDQFGVAMAFSLHGWIARCRGDLQRAEGAIERSLRIVRALGHRPELADNLADLALIAIDNGDYRRAQACSDEGLRFAREVNNAFYLSQHLCIQGHLAALRHEFVQGRCLFTEALRLTAASRFWTQQAFALYHLAGLLAHEADTLEAPQAAAGRRARALELLAAVASHPATWPIYRARARGLSEQLRRALPPAVAGEALAAGERFDWQASVAALLDELGWDAPG